MKKMIRAQFRAQSRKMNRNMTHKTLIIKELCEVEAAGVEPYFSIFNYPNLLNFNIYFEVPWHLFDNIMI